MRKSQLSIEFIASTMIFMFAVVMVISSVFRGYSGVSDSHKDALLRVRAEGVSESILRSSSNGFYSEGFLNYSLITSLPRNNYTAVREVARFKEDYKVSFSYLPSLLIYTFLENPLSKSPTGTSFAFDTFSLSEPVNLTVVARGATGVDVEANNFVLLINQSDYLVDLVNSGNGQVSLRAPYEGVYTVRIISYKKDEKLYGVKELTIGVVST